VLQDGGFSDPRRWFRRSVQHATTAPLPSSTRDLAGVTTSPVEGIAIVPHVREVVPGLVVTIRYAVPLNRAVQALITVQVRPLKQSVIDDFKDPVSQLPEVMTVFVLAGGDEFVPETAKPQAAISGRTSQIAPETVEQSTECSSAMAASGSPAAGEPG